MPEPLPLPRNLTRSVQETTAADRPALAGWAAGLPGRVEALAQRWDLRLGPPYQPGGVASWTAPARTRAGERVVLKVGWRHDEARDEAEGLRAWDGRGTVRLLDAVVTEDTSALLLEACEPGTSLSAALPADEQDVVLSGLFRRVWISPPAGSSFRTLGSMCAWWADSLERRYAAAAASPATTASTLPAPALVAAGAEVLRTLPGTAPDDVLIGTDLHAGNVLAAEREPWLVIDPKPYVGDPAYDPVQHMLNHPGRLAADPHAFVRRMAELTGVDRDRLRQYVFARCAQESLERPDLLAPARALAL